MEPTPSDALRSLARRLRAEDSVITPYVAEPSAAPVLGELAAAGPHAAAAPAEYAVIVEAVREGYLLHYGQPRILADADADLALLAGDYLYAMGLQRLADLGDLGAVHELSDLISLSAHVHGAADDEAPDIELAAALWLAAAVAVGAGPAVAHEAAKAAARKGAPDAAELLLAEVEHRAGGEPMGSRLDDAREAIGFVSSRSDFS
ncbi:MAG: hypothetical protein ABR536_07120 [Solirubrobacterales bacterium]